MAKFFAVLFLTVSFSVSALDLPTRRIEDDSSLRIALRDSWFFETPGSVISKGIEYYTLNGGTRIQVRSEAGREEFIVVLARELSETMEANWRAGSYPGWAQGSWVLTRRIRDGGFTKIRVFLKSDPNTYIQFTPFNQDKCCLDVVLYEACILNQYPIPVPFERLLTLPLEEVLAAAGEKFPRRYFDPEPFMYKDKWSFISAVRSRLPFLEFTDDGAIDENGNYVFIDSLNFQNPSFPEERGGLNCSGFAKWIVDGILKPVTGKLLPVEPLKEAFGERGSSSTQPWERIRDPFFGLDWCRNLASRAGETLRSPSYAVLDEFEVRTPLFSQLVVRQNGSSYNKSYPGFLPDAGFGVEGLNALLYTLAIDEPGRIYLAAVNNESNISFPEENPVAYPRLRQYFHIAVLVPHFNERGIFQIIVFESAAETSFSAFRNRYPGHYVNLVRIPLEGEFDP